MPYGYHDKSLGVGLTVGQFNRIIVVVSSSEPMIYPAIGHVYISLSVGDLKFNQKEVGSSPDILATIALVGTSYQAGCHYSLHVSLLGKMAIMKLS